MSGAIQKVWEIKIGCVVANDNIWVHCADKVAPCLQKLLFLVKGHGVGAHDMCASIEDHDIPDEGLGFALNGDHRSDLDDRIDFGLGEDTLATSALDIETHNSQGCNL